MSNEQFNIIQHKLDSIINNISSQKQWLNTNEVAFHLGYSKESIHKMVKSGEFIQGIHYHKKIKKLLFNIIEIDKWVQSDIPINSSNFNIDKTIEDLLSSIAA